MTGFCVFFSAKVSATWLTACFSSPASWSCEDGLVKEVAFVWIVLKNRVAVCKLEAQVQTCLMVAVVVYKMVQKKNAAIIVLRFRSEFNMWIQCIKMVEESVPGFSSLY